MSSWLGHLGLRAGALALCAASAAGCAEGGEHDRPAAYPSAPPPAFQQAPAQEQPAPDAENAPEIGESTAPGEEPPPGYDPAADADPAALTDFHETLDPYGTWEDDPTYGTVWVPASTTVGPDFAPYVSDGHWAMSDGNEWMWVSDYSWGSVPFHYGRWTWIAGRGWGWIPGRVYAPAWVVWRTGYYDDYYVGWAPMPPSWYWRGGVAISLGYYPPAPYVFCSSAYVFRPGLHAYVVPAARVGVIASSTRPYVAASAGIGGHYAYTHGPSTADAHIPAHAMPAGRVAADPRALSFARPGPAGRLGPSAGVGTAPGYHPGTRVVGPGGGPVYSRPSPGYAGTPHYAPSPASRSYAPSPGARTAPSYGPSHGYSPAPHYAPAPSQHYSPPAQHYAPAPHYSPAPAYRPSAPSPFRGGGGGRRR
jgi:hypothetical protein